MKKTVSIIITLLLLSCLSFSGRAQDSRHLLRLGWGDYLFEKLAFYPSDNTSDYAYTGHLFADYQYSLTPVISVGAQADFSGIFWTTEENLRSRNYDLSLLATLRFTWLRSRWVRLYSGLGYGPLLLLDNAGNREWSTVLSLNPVGVQIGNSPLCCSLDLGMMAAMQSVNRIYMMGSRLVSVSINYRW